LHLELCILVESIWERHYGQRWGFLVILSTIWSFTCSISCLCDRLSATQQSVLWVQALLESCSRLAVPSCVHPAKFILLQFWNHDGGGSTLSWE
jgi:hypothetical protein